ncbi:undecaprenyl-phosphate glucose phosphotransferase [Dysgonomonas sp. 521]|uniref:undecaprenyl-phosphate glucose phosphotransferase n=1 Tax=Dysgonomonas sp. 521 TaxID=2302932 RepID=UPI0013D107AF|nr:undecaprenyl-phosphate glucose phosphotransferase [Dysgonomonas sp. 521]NDV96585.1 undecaprenyl-phosphate glucose phosphotransferase [Dysgonomonas sp. 521]
MNVTEGKDGYGFMIDWIIRIGDLLLINVFFLLAFHFFYDSTPVGNMYSREFMTAFLLINLCYFFIASFIRFHISSNVVYLDSIVQKSSVFIALYAFLITTGFSVFNIVSIPVLPWIVGFFILATLFITWHILFRVVLKIYRRRGYNYRQVIIIGGSQNAVKIHKSLLISDFGYKVMGFFDDDPNKKDLLPNYLGKISEVKAYTQDVEVDEIFCTLPGSEDQTIVDLITYSEKNMIRFHLVPEFNKFIKRRFSLMFLESTPVLSLRNEPLQHFSNRLVKRTFDLLFSILVLLAVFPIIYIIFGAIIKATSPGPVIFKQKRTGKDGRIFNCYKFRSMRPNKEADKLQATAGDSRITKVGAFMRKTSIDELPQFINVFKNDMSVVGPRPHMLKHTELYSSIIDKFMVRHLVKPGITGWAQVTGYRGETKTVEEMEGRVVRDVWYLENWTFFLDLKIIYLTIINVFKGDANAF